MEIRYYPVITEAMIWRKTADWTQKTASYFYPHVLISYAYIGTDKAKNKLHAIRDEVDVLVDSSGFQILSMNQVPNPKDVIHVSQFIGRSGFIVDVPPFTFDTSAIHSRLDVAHFEEDAKRTVEYSRIMLAELERGPADFRLYGVVHGTDSELRSRWLEQTRDDRFKGYGFGPKPPSNPIQTLLCLEFARANGIRTLHLFGLAGVYPMAMVYWYARRHPDSFDKISFDSATPTHFAIRYRWLTDPMQSDPLFIGGRGNTVTDEMMRQVTSCDCSVCKAGEIQRLIADKGGSEKNPSYMQDLISGHNLDIIIRRCELMEKTMTIDDLQHILEERMGRDFVSFDHKAYRDVEERTIHHPLF